MEDREALEPLVPCFGSEVGYGGKPRGKDLWRIARWGKPAIEIAKQLATTPQRKKQIEDAIKRCQQHWQKGYTNHITE